MKPKPRPEGLGQDRARDTVGRRPETGGDVRTFNSALHWRYLVIAGAALLLLVLAAGGYSQHLADRLGANLAKSDELRTTLAESRKLLGYVVDLESGHRGYMLTGDPAQLEAYRVADAALPRQLELLEDLLADRAELQLQLSGMRQSLARKRTEMAPLTLPNVPVEPTLPAHVAAGEDLGKFEMDQLRRSTEMLENALNKLLAEQRKRVQADIEARSMAMNSALIVSALIIIATMLLGALHFDALKRQEQLFRQAQLSRSESAAKSTFLAHVSHEIRTPMNAIFGFGGLLHDRLEDATNRHYIDAITSSARSLLGLINDLLDLSIIESGRIEISSAPSRPRDLVEGVITMMSQQAENLGVRLTADIHSEVPLALNLDGGRVRQMLVNLLSNALKHTETAEIIVRVKAEAGGAADTVSCRFEVEDFGQGIPAEDLEKVFEPFSLSQHKGRGDVSGTGLGLSITRQLARAMGGDVTVRSTVGKGSCFAILLPDLKVCVDSWHAAAGARRLRDLLPQRVLVIEDEELNRQVFGAMFAGSAHEVRMVSSAAEALATVVDWIPDIALIDIHLGGMDGIELTDRLRSAPRLDDTRFIAVTASSYYELTDIRGHFDAVVVKPFYEVTLVRAMAIASAPHLAPLDESFVAAEMTDVAEAAMPNPDLLLELDQLLDERWPSVRDTPTVGEVRTFASAIDEIGSRNGCRAVVQYARKLGGAASSFDIARLEMLLAEFPAHVAEQRARLSPTVPA